MHPQGAVDPVHLPLSGKVITGAILGLLLVAIAIIGALYVTSRTAGEPMGLGQVPDEAVATASP